MGFLPLLIAAHARIDLLRPGIDASRKRADIANAVLFQEGGSVETSDAMVAVNDHQRALGRLKLFQAFS